MDSHNERLMDLAGFRRKNGVRQAELAEYIGKTRGYISVVETSSRRLSEETINAILNRWGGDCGLIPCYGRLVQLEVELVAQGYMEPYHLDSDVIPFSEQISEPVAKNIKYGKIGITDDIANKIVAAFPIVNKGWLLTGEGNMLYDNSEIRLNNIESTLNDLVVSVRSLERYLQIIAKAINVDLQPTEESTSIQGF